MTIVSMTVLSARNSFEPENWNDPHCYAAAAGLYEIGTRFIVASCMFMMISMILGAVVSIADARETPIEKKIVGYIASEDFSSFYTDRQCRDAGKYHVYLIDNFEQKFYIVPEVRTSHGEMLLKLIQSGRDDIDVQILNTALSTGLARVIEDLVRGQCADAVISSTPGSNYTYDQVNSFFSDEVRITPENILYHRSALKKLIRNIAFHGFPSFEWLKQADVNSAKLRNDALKFAFIEALGKFNVPVILPYGNSDAPYKGKTKSVNLLSLASNAMVFSALDQEGERLPGFPYSPLSSGDEPAEYAVVECPHPNDPFKAHLNINNDQNYEYTFTRTGKIAFRDDQGRLSFAPPVISQDHFKNLLARIELGSSHRIRKETVLTADQFRRLKGASPQNFDFDPLKTFVWLNSPTHGRFFAFDAQCWRRGTISGTSVIPPIKVKELLPPKRRK